MYCQSSSNLVSNCELNANSAYNIGGGAFQGTLLNCTLTNNAGDGADFCTLSNCLVTANDGTGAIGGVLFNCRLNGNRGGGASSSSINNCAVFANTGFGVSGGTANNCTLSGNSGWGASSAMLNNCIVYFNTDPNGGNYDSACVLNYCCATPLPTNGLANISADPKMTDSAHLSADSPCLGAASATIASGLDLDGQAWAHPPSIGCDEFYTGPVTGPLTVTVVADYTNVVVGYNVNFSAQINGHATVNFWDLDDGTSALNKPCGLSHSFARLGDYIVRVWAFNDDQPMGVNAAVVVHIEPGLHYVSATNTTPILPYSSWATAATNIQDAVDAATIGGTVIVGDGVYAKGAKSDGYVLDRVVANRPITIRSANGPQITLIDGGGSNRCVYLGQGASLTGFTLKGGMANGSVNSIGEYGGGVFCEGLEETVSNCVISANWAYNGGGVWGGTILNCTISGNSVPFDGGGAADSTLVNCAVNGNSAGYGGGGCYYATVLNSVIVSNQALGVSLDGVSGGGGAFGSWLFNCTLVGNSAKFGGGVVRGQLTNCIVYYNTAPNGANYYDTSPDYSLDLNHCSTSPLPTNGVGNITQPPLLVNPGEGNLRLQSNSPCINAGNNAYAPAGPDLDGNPRIVGGTVDIGAYEFQHPTSIISYAWLQQYGLPTDGSADFADPDGDGMNNWQEWICGTNPTNALSALRIVSALPTGANVVVTWQSVAGITYFLESSTNLAVPGSFGTIATGLPGQAGVTAYSDTNASAASAVFYRVGVAP